jgi:glycosyltransferase involved in cell wall biosynthesis
MACGLPVVATAVGGLTETVIDGETGYLVDPGDIDAFSHHIRTLHESPSLRFRLGQRGRQQVIDEYSRAVLLREFRTAVASASG